MFYSMICPPVNFISSLSPCLFKKSDPFGHFNDLFPAKVEYKLFKFETEIR